MTTELEVQTPMARLLEVDSAGEVHFEPAPGDRGTVVCLKLHHDIIHRLKLDDAPLEL
jgi:hypothetical protein